MAIYKRIDKPQWLKDKRGTRGGNTTDLYDALPFMTAASSGGGIIFDCRHFVYDTFEGVYPFPITTRINCANQIFVLREYEL